MYDALNQLIRENNQAEGYTYVYTYDSGNITSRKKYAYTTGTLGAVLETRSWSYDAATWGDLLTGYNDGTSNYTVASDGAGNITAISNGSGSSTTHTWLGRTLQTATLVENGVTTTVNYSYNAEGQRIQKVVGDTTTTYCYNGDVLAGMTIGSNKLIFMYDENGTPFGFTYNGTAYYYLKNLQGDVIAITNENCFVMVEYSYDAWGNVLDVSGTLADTIGEINPIRYRGYYYDTETGYYYLNSRYYAPDLCRFISADIQLNDDESILGANLFAYCYNNPVNMIDVDGRDPISITLALLYLMCSAIAAYGTVTLVSSDWFQASWSNMLDSTNRAILNAVSVFEGSVAKLMLAEESEVPEVEYPGDDPTVPPEGYEWRGSGEQGSKEGSYYNPNTDTSLHPDLDHPLPIGPHWDYKDPAGKWWRIRKGNVPMPK